MFDDNVGASDIFGDKLLADELLAAEANAPAVEKPLRLKPAAPQTVHSRAPAFGASGQLSDNSVSGRSLTVGIGNSAVKIPLAIGASFIAALLGAILWAVVACVTGYECSIIAWGVGVLAGFGLTLFIDSRGIGIGLLACLFAFLGILMGKFFITNWYIMPRLEQEFRQFEPGQEHITKLLENSDMMFSVACLQLAENEEFEEALAWQVIAAHYAGELPSEDKQEIEAARQKTLELLNNWSDSEKKAAAQAQYAKLMDKISDFMIKTKIGLLIAFIAAFSLWDLLWFPVALCSAYKIGAGRD
jgi:phosphate/sulfate permease